MEVSQQTAINSKVDLLVSYVFSGTKARFFKWVRIFGSETESTMLMATMPVDEQATYSAPLKAVLVNVQTKRPEQPVPAVSTTTSVATLQKVEPLTETEVGGIRLVPKQVLDGRVEMLVPAEFGPMSDEMIRVKYPSTGRPNEILSDESGGVNLAFTYSPQKVTPETLPQMYAAMDRLFHANKNTEWHASELTAVSVR